MSAKEERPVSAVVSDIVGNFQDIVRSEVKLAKAQIKNEAAQAAKSARHLAFGVVLALYAVGLLLLAAVCLLSMFMPAWIGALIICLIVSIVAGAMFLSGRRRWSGRRATEKPINVTKENVLWMNAQTK